MDSQMCADRVLSAERKWEESYLELQMLRSMKTHLTEEQVRLCPFLRMDAELLSFFPNQDSRNQSFYALLRQKSREEETFTLVSETEEEELSQTSKTSVRWSLSKLSSLCLSHLDSRLTLENRLKAQLSPWTSSLTGKPWKTILTKKDPWLMRLSRR